MPSEIPRATYRVQMRAEFGFDEAAAITGYLARLGISHLYCSPYVQARAGSTHGYDVVNHGRLNPELGGEEAHARMLEALRTNGMSHILDVVPNHMAINDPANEWWWDVLKEGRDSRFAGFFDIDWDPPESKLARKILLPVLGDHYGRVLLAGELVLKGRSGEPVVAYHDHEFPLSDESVRATFGASPTDEELKAFGSVTEDLHELLESQHYRLARWTTSTEDLNYRRFFAINDLVALRAENLAVFATVHALVLELVRGGALEGIRIDHIDGLRRPRAYLERLRAEAPDTYIVVEKILEPAERLPDDWPVQGTTGYDFLNLVGGLFVDPRGEEPLQELWTGFTGGSTGLEEERRRSKLKLLFDELASDLERVTDILADVCERRIAYRDYTRRELRWAIAEVVAAFPVYRTYADAATHKCPARDRLFIREAIAAARTRREDLEGDLFDLLQSVLTLDLDGPTERNFAMRVQQLTGPVMAKGIEDTLFYTYNRLSCLNEVGGDPGRFGVEPREFHDGCLQAASTWPATILATSTHDTKRSEDARVRIALLSEIPGPWAEAVGRWSRMNERHRSHGLPDRNMEYLLYQTLVGAWPLSLERAAAYMEKASKEAKEHTSWVAPDAAYDAALRGFVQGALSDDEFCNDLAAFVAPLIEPGRVNSLAQTLVKLTAPGVPDIYQGCELWNLSLVDPDNRRAVDYAARTEMLDLVEGAPPEAVLGMADSGAPKLWLTQRCLTLRARLSEAFVPGATYEPLEADGARAAHAVAYARAGVVVAVAPRLVLGLGGDWGDTSIRLPSGLWRDELIGDHWEGTVPLHRLLGRFPVALLTRHST